MEQIKRIDTNQLKISFCIPTYNRAPILDQCLQSIVSQPSFETSAEIVISDNASTDNTHEVAIKYQNKYPYNIRYNRNTENIGMEANFLKALELGNGKLLKLLNDYAILEPKSLNHFIKIIDDNSDENAIIFFRNKPNKKREYKLCTDFDSFLRDVTYWTTWIGTFSIWKNDFINIKGKEKLIGLLFFHMLLLFENFRKKKRIIIDFKKLLCNNRNITFKSGYNFYEIFIQNYIGIILHNLYKKREINSFTLRKIKSKFCVNFLHYEIYKINNERISYLTYCTGENYKLIKYFKFYPEFYISFIYVHIKFYIKNKLGKKI